MNPEELRERLLQINDRCNEITALSAAEKRDITGDEQAEMDALAGEFDRNKERLTLLERVQGQTELLNAGKGRKTQATQPKPGEDEGDLDDALPPAKSSRQLATVGNSRIPAEPIKERKGGYRSLGEMAYSVARACMEGGITDPRLERLATATTWGNEQSGADGGFGVPQDFKNEIMAKVLGEDSLLTRCDQINTTSNNFTMIVDETTPWQTSGGIQAYWDGESVAATQSKPEIESRSVKLNKVRALVPVTEELLDDAPAMDAYLRRKAPEKINFKVSLAILQGTGTGQPLGLINSPALVSVAKETSQVADTLVAMNIVKMWNRLYAPCRPRSIWLLNQDLEVYLNTMSLAGRDNTSAFVTTWGAPVYMPAGGLSGLPYSTLYGRPVVFTQAAAAIGDQGDIFVADMTQYLALLKSGQNPRVETSMHLWFDQDLMAFKFVLRVGGIPWWGASIAPRSGSNNLSFAVTLDAR